MRNLKLGIIYEILNTEYQYNRNISKIKIQFCFI